MTWRTEVKAGGIVKIRQAIDVAEHMHRDGISLLKILELSKKKVDEGRLRPANEVFADLRRRCVTGVCGGS